MVFFFFNVVAYRQRLSHRKREEKERKLFFERQNKQQDVTQKTHSNYYFWMKCICLQKYNKEESMKIFYRFGIVVSTAMVSISCLSFYLYLFFFLKKTSISTITTTMVKTINVIICSPPPPSKQLFYILASSLQYNVKFLSVDSIKDPLNQLIDHSRAKIQRKPTSSLIEAFYVVTLLDVCTSLIV